MKIKRTYLLFYLAFDIYIIYKICISSYYSKFITSIGEDIIKLTILLLILLEILFEQKFYIKKLVFIVFLGIGSLLIYVKTSISEALVITFLIIGANRLDLRKIVRQSIPIIISLTLFIILSSLTGIIPNDIFLRNVEKEKMVKAFGFYGYATIPYIFLMLNLLYTYTKSAIKCRDLLLWTNSGLFIYFVFTNRLVLILQFFFYIIHGISKRTWRYREKIYKKISLMLPWLLGGVSFILTNYLDLTNSIMFFINDVLSWRLYYGKIGIEKYSIGLFGQYIEMTGNMAIGKESDMKYFYIDCGYIHTLLTYGILFTVLILVLYAAIEYYAVVSGDLILFCIVITILFGNCINNLWLRLDINPILLLSFSALSTKRKSRLKENHRINKKLCEV